MIGSVTTRTEGGARSRLAALVVASRAVSADEISAALSVVPDRLLRIGEVSPRLRVPVPARTNTWAIESAGDAASALQEHLDAVLRRAMPLAEPLRELRARDCVIKLDLVQWISADDPEGPGFALDADQVGFLSAIGAVVDVDQYLG
jgi:hypothetical protein